HRHYPYFQLQLENDRQALYEVAFNYVNFHVYESLEQAAGFEARGGQGFEATNFAMTVNFADTSDGLSIDMKIDPSRLSARQGGRVLAYYVAALTAIAADAQADHSLCDLLSNAERQQLRSAANEPEASYEQEGTLHGRFEAQAALMPEVIAVEFESERLSYGELNARANRLAHRLIAAGVSKDDRV
ncbi:MULTISPECIES: AMP-binding protein, partial [unclassified Burkholderia]